MTPRTDTITIYEDDAGLTRWRWRASNGKILADSGQGYVNERGAVAVASRLGAALGVPVIDERNAPPKGGWWRRSRR